jgi:PAS domain S-box-containing protein
MHSSLYSPQYAAHKLIDRRWQWAWDSLGLAGGMLVITALSAAVIRASGDPWPIYATRLPLPWIPLGIAVGVLYFRGATRWPGVFLGTIGAALAVGGIPPLAALVQALSATVFSLGMRTLLRAWKVNPALERWQDPLLLWTVAVMGATGMACFAGTAVVLAAGLQRSQVGYGVARMLLDLNGHPILRWPLLSFVACWTANWTSGIALVLPAMRLLNFRSWRHLSQRLREVLFMALVLTGWAVAAFLPLPWIATLPLFLVGLVLVIWSGMRFGGAVGSLIPFALALIESGAFITGRGPLHSRPDEAIIAIWTFIFVISVLGMLVTSLLAERDAAFRRQATSEMRYRVLFEASPQPQWVYDPTTLRILMVNEAALRLYGYSLAAFTTLTLWSLDAGSPSQSSEPEVHAADLDVGERRHRTSDGAILEVELHSKPIEFDGRAARLVFSEDVTDRNRLRGALLDASDRAGRKLGQELHDGLGQDLVALSLLARAETVRLTKGGTADPQILQLIESVALRAAENCRGIARGLSALTETGGDLAAAIRRLPDRFGQGPPVITVTIDEDAALDLDEGAQDHIFRIAQEALTNAVKHAAALNIEVALHILPTSVTLSVCDDGIGLPQNAARGIGLGGASMRHRASAIGASLYVVPAAGGGTLVRLECAQGAAPGAGNPSTDDA